MDKNGSLEITRSKTGINSEHIFSKKVLEYANKPLHMGRMNDPSTSAWIKGVCGETIEIYLIIENNRIKTATFFTDGCEATLACGSAATLLAINKSIEDVLSISPQHIIDHLESLPKEHIHCAILAASTLHKAIADYLLQY